MRILAVTDSIQTVGSFQVGQVKLLQEVKTKELKGFLLNSVVDSQSPRAAVCKSIPDDSNYIRSMEQLTLGRYRLACVREVVKALEVVSQIQTGEEEETKFTTMAFGEKAVLWTSSLQTNPIGLERQYAHLEPTEQIALVYVTQLIGSGDLSFLIQAGIQRSRPTSTCVNSVSDQNKNTASVNSPNSLPFSFSSPPTNIPHAPDSFFGSNTSNNSINNTDNNSNHDKESHKDEQHISLGHEELPQLVSSEEDPEGQSANSKQDENKPVENK